MFKLYKEFKEFAVKGNMIDIAIGVIIGASFNKVIDALVKEIFLPPLALVTNGIEWSNKKIVLRHAIMEGGSIKIPEVSMGYGILIENSVDFLIIAIIVFGVVKFMNGLRKRAHDVKDHSVETPKDIELLNKISELLEEQNALLGNKSKPDAGN